MGWFEGGNAGGILELAQLTGEHLHVVLQDFRSIYNTSFWDVTVQEVWPLLLGLLVDPASRFHAAVAEWPSPVSREQLVLMDLYDRFVNANFKKPHVPYPRPWDHKPARRQISDEQAMAILRPT